MKNVFLAVLALISISNPIFAAGFPWATNDVLTASDLNSSVISSRLPNPNANILGIATDFATGWTATNGTKLSAQLDFYGAAKAIKFTESSANGQMSNTTSLAIPAGRYVVSAYFKLDGTHYSPADIQVDTASEIVGRWYDSDCSTRNPSGTEVAHGCIALPGGEWIWAWLSFDLPNPITFVRFTLHAAGTGVLYMAFPQLKPGTSP